MSHIATTISNLDYKLKFFNYELRWTNNGGYEYWFIFTLREKDVKLIGNIFKGLKFKFACTKHGFTRGGYYFTSIDALRRGYA